MSSLRPDDVARTWLSRDLTVKEVARGVRVLEAEGWWDFGEDTASDVTRRLVGVRDQGHIRDLPIEEVGCPPLPGRVQLMVAKEFVGLDRLGRQLSVDVRSWPYERNGREWRRHGSSLLITWGPVGVGKTHLAAHLAGSAFRVNLSVSWWGVAAWCRALKAAIATNSVGRHIDHAIDVDFLVFDELVLGDLSDFDGARVSEVIRGRYEDGKPMVVTTNDSPERLQEFDPRLASRLLGVGAIQVPLGGRDRRAREMKS